MTPHIHTDTHCMCVCVPFIIKMLGIILHLDILALITIPREKQFQTRKLKLTNYSICSSPV